MKNLDKHEWEFTDGEKYAIKWLEENEFDVVIKKRYVSKTIFLATKNGVSDELHLPNEDCDYKSAMERFARDFERYCELVQLRAQVKAQAHQG